MNKKARVIIELFAYLSSLEPQGQMAPARQSKLSGKINSLKVGEHPIKTGPWVSQDAYY